MEFRIADTFTDSLSKLTNEEQKAVKTTAFDLQVNPASPGMKFHKLEKAKDKRFWSVRISSDLRLIVHKTESSLLLCFVGHHDNAYQWAECRKLETHPQTGAAQLVEIRETVKEIIIPQYTEVQKPSAPVKPLLFANYSEEELLKYGVPPEWIDDVRKANEDTILELADHLPGEAAEALLCLATGTLPQIIPPAAVGSDPFTHPDAERRFRTMHNIEELERALEYPWEKWIVFLHPAQRQMVEKDYGGPARVSGSAGTGKTIVALHRAVFLARSNPDARVLLTTFSDTLANALRLRMIRLISNAPRIGERLECIALNEIGRRLYEANYGRTSIVSDVEIAKIMKEASAEVPGHKFPLSFLITEWKDVVDAWQLNTWEQYRDARRLGRKSRLPEKQRVILWSIFEKVRTKLQAGNLLTYAEIFTRLAGHFAKSKKLSFDYIVVDEAQDISISQLRFLAALGAGRPNSLFFAGDLGQRIFQQPFSWKALGVDIRGRSRTLRINYRTSHQIRMQADRLLGKEIMDVDGNKEERRGIVSVFNGPKPAILVCDSQEKEIDAVAKWLSDRISEGTRPYEIGVFVRSDAQLPRAKAALEKSQVAYRILDDTVETASGQVSISTMHLAKGLEFRAVCVMACDDEVIPLQERIETAGDDADLEEVYNTERHLLYVACTRARDHLLITSGDSPSEFIDDLRI
jgi:mRNA-degrading endonuclease RelE of RelBE toxin-antitoxin system